MQKYENAQKEMVDRMMNLHLNSLELGSKVIMGVDFGVGGSETVISTWKDHQLTESTVLTDTDLRICKYLLQKEIALKEIKKRWFYGVNLYVKSLLMVLWLRNIRILIWQKK